MAPKRKSDTVEQETVASPVDVLADSQEVNADALKPVAKKARVADASTSKGKGKSAVPTNWWEVKLDGEGDVRVYFVIFLSLVLMNTLPISLT